jgi:prepilin-type N-terminal cleavage/methylation domain-containing protein
MVRLRDESGAVNLRGQRGMTLVELLMAMTVTAIVLLGISGALMVGYHVAALWGQKISEAQTANQLSGWLDQDLHRYVPCSPQGGELDLCLPGDPAQNHMVTYKTSVPAGGCPCAIVRTDVITGAQSVVTRDLVTVPLFVPRCGTAGGGEPGYLEVSSLQYESSSEAPPPSISPQPLTLDFRAPGVSCP